eukprot:TRINITY_DN67142_c7_g11_i1.p1 TRINITY_DN67142_c7_g11~~TRINITY_DN67142_c7_g11_i1.p1  ORF type:complete len:1491 (-),score=162.72 TRINITY_DN67142_c7_g11_i1:94-4032(-)
MSDYEYSDTFGPPPRVMYPGPPTPRAVTPVLTPNGVALAPMPIMPVPARPPSPAFSAPTPTRFTSEYVMDVPPPFPLQDTLIVPPSTPLPPDFDVDRRHKSHRHHKDKRHKYKRMPKDSLSLYEIKQQEFMRDLNLNDSGSTYSDIILLDDSYNSLGLGGPVELPTRLGPNTILLESGSPAPSHHSHKHGHRHHHHHRDHDYRDDWRPGHSPRKPMGYVSPYTGQKLVASTPYYRPPGAPDPYSSTPSPSPSPAHHHGHHSPSHYSPSHTHSPSHQHHSYQQQGQGYDNYPSSPGGMYHHHPPPSSHAYTPSPWETHSGRHGSGAHQPPSNYPPPHHQQPPPPPTHEQQHTTVVSPAPHHQAHAMQEIPIAPHHSHGPPPSYHDQPSTGGHGHTASGPTNHSGGHGMTAGAGSGGGGHGHVQSGGGHGMTGGHGHHAGGGHGMAGGRPPNQQQQQQHHHAHSNGHGHHHGGAVVPVGGGHGHGGHQYQPEAPPHYEPLQHPASPQAPHPGPGGNWIHGDVYVVIHRARNLVNLDSFGRGKTDAYVRLNMDGPGGTKVKGPRTKTIMDDLNPEWEELMHIPVAGEHDSFDLVVKDEDIKIHELVGEVRLNVPDLVRSPKQQEIYKIDHQSRKPRGDLVVSAWYVPSHKSSTKDETALKNFTRFPMRSGCRVRLYQDAHFDGCGLPLPKTSYDYRKNCWREMYDAIEHARTFIYITGWSVWTKLMLCRDDPSRNKTLGEQLKQRAEAGVRVNLLIWDDATSTGEGILSSVFATFKHGVMGVHDEETKQFFKGTNVNVVLAGRATDASNDDVGGTVSPKMWPAFFTHHQKSVILDADPFDGGRARRVVAFVGGLDITNGRYDTPSHPLYSTLNTAHKDDYYQGDIPNPQQTLGPREPWHDIHSFVEGPIAHDIKTNFEERWHRQAKRPNLLEGLPGKLLSPDQDRVPSDDSWNVQMFRSVDYFVIERPVRNPPFLPYRPTMQSHKAPSVAGKDCEATIHLAYIHHIRRAEKFIYIENQYFLGSARDWDAAEYASKLPLRNRIPAELAARCIEKIYARQPFHVYVIVPMWPEGVPESGPVQTILHWQFHTVNMMYTRIANALRAMGSDLQPTDYFGFYCLGTKEPVGPGAPMSQIGNQLEARYKQVLIHRRHPVYVHSKMMIVDDDYIILGSANINDRSMAGDRDSEIAVGCYQPHYMDRGSSSKKGDVHWFRRGLFAEHLHSNDEIFKEAGTVACARRVRQLAEANWEVYADPSATMDTVTPLPHGHLMPYPYIIDRDGMIRPKVSTSGRAAFPDNDAALIAGQPSGVLPFVLTT